jgi:hypothetical protein
VKIRVIRVLSASPTGFNEERKMGKLLKWLTERLFVQLPALPYRELARLTRFAKGKEQTKGTQ